LREAWDSDFAGGAAMFWRRGGFFGADLLPGSVRFFCLSSVGGFHLPLAALVQEQVYGDELGDEYDDDD